MRHRWPFWLEVAAAAGSFGSLALNLVWNDWIEVLLRVDPDRGSGRTELLITVLTTLFACTFSILAHREWRRARAVARVRAPEEGMS